MIDCGEGAQMQLMKYQGNLHRISNIFISHLHGDHYLGLMGLMFTMHLLRRTNDLHIHSQPGLDEILTAQLRYSRSSLNYKVFFHRITPETKEVIYEDESLTVETIPLVHKLPCSGFLFKEKIKPRRVNKEVLPSGLRIQQIADLKKGFDVVNNEGVLLHTNESLTYPPRHSRTYAYCSDTAYHEKLIEQIKGIDILYHEATFTVDEQQKAIETKHSTAKEAAMIATKAQVKQLVIGHFSARYRELAPVLEEAKSVFENTHLAIEGESFSISE